MYQQHPPSGSEEIVGKLHGALAVFRKERDDLHRSKELSQERLRLISEERKAMEKTVNAMQAKLNELNSKVQGNGESSDLAEFQAEVERLDKEVKFQHAELVSKRQKYSEFKTKLHNDAKKREAVLATALDNERKVRESKQSVMTTSDTRPSWESVSSNESPCGTNRAGTIDTRSSNLMQLSEHDLFYKLPRFIEEKTNSLLEHGRDIQEQTQGLKRRKQALEAFIASLNNAGDMGQ